MIFSSGLGEQNWRTDALRLAIKQDQDCRAWLYHRAMAALPIQRDRARRIPLAAQIYWAIREGIDNGRLTAGARLPSCRDLAAQLGVFRGTVRCGLRASQRGAIRDRRCWRLRYVRANRVGKQGLTRDVPSHVRGFHHIILQNAHRCSCARGRSPASADTRDVRAGSKSRTADPARRLSAIARRGIVRLGIVRRGIARRGAWRIAFPDMDGLPVHQSNVG
jgi:hypothetical protein